MDNITQSHFENLDTTDRAAQNRAYAYLMEVTDSPVTWAYRVWAELVKMLRHKDNHQRAIAAQILCNLAKSDPEQRMLQDFDKLLAVTKDERFVTARHCLQALWKVGAAGPQQQQIVVDGFTLRFNECIAEKNCTLIRFDITQGLKQLYDAVQDETIRERALALIATEQDEKYRKKYAAVWKSKQRQ